MADDNGVIVAGGNAGAKLLAVTGFKILFGGHKDIGGGIEPQELRRPLLRQVVWHRKEGFLAQAEALSLHGCGDHLKCLARAHLMGKERIAAVEVVGDGIELMPRRVISGFMPGKIRCLPSYSRGRVELKRSL